jgi:hypothetical protein
LVEIIRVDALSEEGAANLLTQPDNSDKVDLNNDGILEVGIGLRVVFPPVNAPQSIKLAWVKATEDMSEGDKMLVEMHMAVFGVNMDGKTNKPAVNPAQQWSQAGLANLLGNLRNGLEFDVSLDGWTQSNLLLKNFYDNLESALNSPPILAPAEEQQTAAAQPANDEEVGLSVVEGNEVQTKLMQLFLSARLGIDKEKLNEIDKNIQELENDNNIDNQKRAS